VGSEFDLECEGVLSKAAAFNRIKCSNLIFRRMKATGELSD
jgi:hypothetical protein